MHHPPVVHLLLSMRIINACPEHRACSGLHERTASTRIAAPGGVVVILLYIIIVCCANGRQQSAQHRCDDCRGFAVDCLLQILLNHRMRDGHASQRFQRHLQPLHSLQYCSFNATYARTRAHAHQQQQEWRLGVVLLLPYLSDTLERRISCKRKQCYNQRYICRVTGHCEMRPCHLDILYRCEHALLLGIGWNRRALESVDILYQLLWRIIEAAQRWTPYR
jgi:hypothetical protein